MQRFKQANRQQSGDRGTGGGGGGGESLDHHRNQGPDRCGSERGGSQRQKGGIGMLLRQAERFDLTDGQVAKLSAMRVECELTKVDKKAALRKAKIRLRAAVRSDDDDDLDEIRKLINKVCRCEAELRLMRYKNLKMARAVLNEKQLSRVNTFRRDQEQSKVRQFRQQRQPA